MNTKKLERVLLAIAVGFAFFWLMTLVCLGQESGPYYPGAGANAALSTATPAGLVSQNLVAAWSAASFITDTDGVAITTWPDLSGNGWNLTCTSLSYSHNGCGGNPGIWFPWETGFALCTNFLTRGLDTNITIVIVDTDVSAVGGNGAQAAWIISMGTNAPGSFYWQSDTGNNGAILEPGYGNQYGTMGAGEVDVMCMNYSGQKYSAWQNSFQVIDGLYPDGPSSYPQTTGLGTNGEIWVGGYLGRAIWSGYINLILIYTNLTPSQIQQNRNVLNAIYLPSNRALLSGDSITIGLAGSAYSNMTYFATSALPGWDVGNSGKLGATSANQLQYLRDNLPMLPKGQVGIVSFMEQVNDDVASLTPAQTLANYETGASICHSNGWKFVAGNPMSYSAGDSDGSRTNFNNLLRTTWHSFADGLADYASVPAMGSNNACLNTNLFISDHTHPTAAGYMLMSNIEVQSFQQILSPNITQFGVLYPSNSLANLQSYTNQIPPGGTLIIYTNSAAASTSGAAKLYNSNGLITLTPGT